MIDRMNDRRNYMKHESRLIRIALISCVVVAMAFTMFGCSSGQGEEQSEAANNRAYMANLNRQASDLQDVMDDFEKAAAENDVVTMQAKLKDMDQIIDTVKDTTATERLSSVKDGYVDALTTLREAMGSYVSLYNEIKSGSIDSKQFDTKLAEIQSVYDSGIEKMKNADQIVKDIANE